MTEPFNSFHIIYFSRVRGNASQWYQLVGMRGDQLVSIRVLMSYPNILGQREIEVKKKLIWTLPTHQLLQKKKNHILGIWFVNYYKVMKNNK